MGKIYYKGESYGGGGGLPEGGEGQKTEVAVEQKITSGIELAIIGVDEDAYSIYAPLDTIQGIIVDNTVVPITNNIATITLPNMEGATSVTAGSHGLVPAPAITDINNFLKGDGTWGTPPTGSDVEANPADTATQLLNTVKINNIVYAIAGGGSGSTISITPILSTGTKIAEYEIDGVSGDLYAPSGGGTGSTVSITPSLSTGTKIADFEIDGSSGSLFAPAGGGGTTAYGGTTPPAASLGNNGDFYYQYDSIDDEMTMTFYVKLNNVWRKILTPSGGSEPYYKNNGNYSIVGNHNTGLEGTINE